MKILHKQCLFYLQINVETILFIMISAVTVKLLKLGRIDLDLQLMI